MNVNSEMNNTDPEAVAAGLKAMQDEPISALPNSLVERTIAMGQPTPSTPDGMGGFSILKVTIIGAGAVSMATVALVVLTFTLISAPTSVTFAQVIGKVAQTKSVRFAAVISQKGQDQPRTRVFLQGDFMRYEFSESGPVMILNTNTRQGIELHPMRKVAKKIDLVGAVPANELLNLMEQLRNLREQKGVNVESLPDEKIAATDCKVYMVQGATALRTHGDWKLWISKKTALPVQLKVGEDNGSLTLLDFKWNAKFKADAFSLKPPKGYSFESAVAVAPKKNQLHYHHFRDVYSIGLDGKGSKRQFPPRMHREGLYVPDSVELSPDGRYLAVAYTSHWGRGSHPPDRVFLFNRTAPKERLIQIFDRAKTELNLWRFSPDGNQLYVGYWAPQAGKKWPHGLGAEVIHLRTGKRQRIPLPMYKAEDGQSLPARFASATNDGKQYLVVGRVLTLIDQQGKTIRKLSTTKSHIVPNSVRVSQKGERALFAAWTKAGFELRTVALSTGKSKAIIPAGKFSEIRARWSPDDRQIAFSCRSDEPQSLRRAGRKVFLYTIQADGTKLKLIKSDNQPTRANALELIAWR